MKLEAMCHVCEQRVEMATAYNETLFASVVVSCHGETWTYNIPLTLDRPMGPFFQRWHVEENLVRTIGGIAACEHIGCRSDRSVARDCYLSRRPTPPEAT